VAALTPDALDDFARTYYTADETAANVDLEETAQRLAMPRIVAALRGAGPVLEMGFGTGLVTAELLAAGVDVEVVEGSPLLADLARRRHPGLVVHEAMFETFQPPRPYEAVLALHVLEHVDVPTELLAVIRRWLVPGGAVIVVVPNRESLHRRIAVRMGLHERLDDLSPSDHLVGHQRVYDLADLTADLAAGGFRVEDDFGYLCKTVPNSMMLGYPTEMVRALNEISEELPTRLLANIGVRAAMV
jgi:2-polyprenyl-3-methyl-5-hydroxy-6-metoxy-1,4-benzoquinol methylase